MNAPTRKAQRGLGVLLFLSLTLSQVWRLSANQIALIDANAIAGRPELTVNSTGET